MDGGIRAWEGLVSGGTPESGMAYFGDAATAEELIGLSWVLEEGSRRFYAEVPEVVPDTEMKALFAELTKAEEHHKQSLSGLYRKVAGSDPGEDFPKVLISGDVREDVMEGGLKVREALEWCRGKAAGEVLELALSLETQAYDLYLRMYRHLAEKDAGKVFHLLATEEKGHLERLTGLFEKKMQTT